MKKDTFLLIGMGITLLVAVAFVASGWLYLGVKKPSEKVIINQTICSNERVGEYNALPVTFDSEAKSKLASMSEDIKSTSGSHDDATCQAILFSNALQESDVQEMQSVLGRIKELASLGRFADPRLRDSLSIQTMEQFVSTSKYINGINREEGGV